MLSALCGATERTVALLAFEDARSCPVADLMDIAQRQKTASELNAAILASQCQVRWQAPAHLLRHVGGRWRVRGRSMGHASAFLPSTGCNEAAALPVELRCQVPAASLVLGLVVDLIVCW